MRKAHDDAHRTLEGVRGDHVPDKDDHVFGPFVAPHVVDPVNDVEETELKEARPTLVSLLVTTRRLHLELAPVTPGRPLVLPTMAAKM